MLCSLSSLLDGSIVNAIETKNLRQIWSSFSPLWISILDWIISRLVCRETAPETRAGLVAIILGVDDQEDRWPSWCSKYYIVITLQVTAPRNVLSFAREPIQTVESGSSSSSATLSLITVKLCLFFQLQLATLSGSYCYCYCYCMRPPAWGAPARCCRCSCPRRGSR